MAEEASASKEPFNLATLRELVELMEKHDVTEISLRHGDEQWRLRRGGQAIGHFMPAPGLAPNPPLPAMPPAQLPPQSTPAPVAAPSNTIEIKSPTVGTFYASPSPEDPPFVQVGSKVQPDTVVCIVEAMKVFNQITADCIGVIAEVLVKNGDSVEYGQPLFRVRPS